MKTSRSTDTEPRTPAASATPWKGRLRSHPMTPQNVPTQRFPPRSKNWNEVEEVQISNKRTAPKNLERDFNGSAGDACLSKTPLLRSLQLTGNDPEHPIVIDQVREECKPRDNRLAIKSFRRSPRFHQEYNNSGKQILPAGTGEIAHSWKTQKTVRKSKIEESLKKNKRNASVESQKPLEPCQGLQDIPPGKKIADVSHKKSEKQVVEPRHCEVMTGKRKRGNREKSASKRKSQDPKSSPSDFQEITATNEPRKYVVRNMKKNLSIIRHTNIDVERLITVDEINKVASEVESEGRDHCCGSDDWTEEQDMALRNAYFNARPSPHFWKKVSKMVPGRSAEECSNRIHADLSTPTPITSRPRTCKTFSPLGKFTLSDSLPNSLEHTVLRQKTAKQKNLAAQKTVRHLLHRHCLIDQTQEADHFSVFETSPGSIQLNISLEDSPETPDSYMSSGSLNKCSGSSSAQKKPLSRLRAKKAEPSPPVLKPLKNAVLHERYINQLSRQEGSKRSCKRTSGSKAADSDNFFPKKQASGLKAAKNALIAEATDFIGHFKKLQANSHAHIVENSENDETGCTECDAGYDYCDDKE